MSKLSGRQFVDALVRAGVVAPNDLDSITRLVIDVPASGPVTLHIRRIGDWNLLDVASLLAGAEITGSAPDTTTSEKG